MSSKKPTYQCIRCGYESERKDNMRKHLFTLHKTCPGCLNDIELTQELKEKILSNRRIDHKVKPKEKESEVVNPKIINNYNNVSNFIAGMDTIDKLDKALLYSGESQVDYEDKLEKKFGKRIERLEDKTYRAAYVLDKESIYDLFNYVTRVNKDEINELSCLFDKKIGRLKIYRSKEWESYLEEIGIRELVSLIKSYFLNNYEIYLIKHLHDPSSLVANKRALLEHLYIYYKFIAIFDIPPYILGMTDYEIINFSVKENNDHYLEQQYMKIYSEQKKELKQSERNITKKRLAQIVKENTLQNVDELNKVILEYLKINKSFREDLIADFSVDKIPEV